MDNYWKGKTICFLGDSITEGVGVVPGERYFEFLSKELGFTACGYGVNGARYVDLYEQALRMKKEFGSNTDAIFIFAGTNDFFLNTPPGEWFNYAEEDVAALKNDDGTPLKIETRKVRQFNFDTDTYKGSINRLMSFLKHNYAEKQIFMLTPLHRAYAEFGPLNIQYSEMYSNSLGIFFDEYVNAIREAAQIWAAELIDMYSISGLYPLYDESAGKYFCHIDTDRLHPNKEGHKKIAEILKRKI